MQQFPEALPMTELAPFAPAPALPAPPAPLETKEHIPELDYVIGFDLETTGTDEQKDQVLEVAAVFGRFSNGLFSPILRFERVLPLVDVCGIATWPDAVVEMHTKNGLLTESLKLRKTLRESGLAPNDYREEIDTALEETCTVFGNKDRSWTLLGNSVHFDLRFAKVAFPKFARKLSHRVMDVSSIRLFCEMLGRPYLKGDVAHRAMPDVEMSLASLDTYRRWVRP